MSILIASSPPIPSLFLDIYQERLSSASKTRPMCLNDSRSRLLRAAPNCQRKSTFMRPTARISDYTRRSKSVVFADTMGLPLTQVQVLKAEQFDDYIEQIPVLPSSLLATKEVIHSPNPLKPGLKLNFSQPITRPDLLETVRSSHLSLENLLVEGFTLTGTVLVHNLCFNKEITVRYTKDYWLSHTDIPATFLSSLTPDIDKFTFILALPGSLPAGARVEFSLCARLGDAEFWDNNSDQNYQVECILMSPEPGDPLMFGLLVTPNSRGVVQNEPPSSIYY